VQKQEQNSILKSRAGADALCASAGTVWFDPLGLAAEPAAFERLRVQELKHGRLAMVAWVGFAAQAALTREGPLENALAFARDPAHNNALAYLRS
jgi:light-harvesting complex II chlorophyll a/b binding protein 7